ncbi:hypothetical protein FGO68_gene6061 [Halteria grandinella]|uniref:Uncharacterized protein n=1 Tax=Halteria grandinella TaxID=5974 RepID=A0A8J8NP23_HALGN|nr:hypothetical protein FGO68_gene6061 [Halteria grandinella]
MKDSDLRTKILTYKQHLVTKSLSEYSSTPEAPQPDQIAALSKDLHEVKCLIKGIFSYFGGLTGITDFIEFCSQMKHQLGIFEGELKRQADESNRVWTQIENDANKSVTKLKSELFAKIKLSQEKQASQMAELYSRSDQQYENLSSLLAKDTSALNDALSSAVKESEVLDTIIKHQKFSLMRYRSSLPRR